MLNMLLMLICGILIVVFGIALLYLLNRYNAEIISSPVISPPSVPNSTSQNEIIKVEDILDPDEQSVDNNDGNIGYK